MAKKRVKRKSRAVKRVSRQFRARESKNVQATPKKFGIVVKNLLVFAILFIASLLLYSVSNIELYSNLFFLLSILSGFVVLAFLLVFLILLFLRLAKK
jgi:hypothetical protein